MTDAPRNPVPSTAPDDASLTWAMLVARWMEFAKASVALPKDGPLSRWRQVVPDIIELQAITHALAELDRLTRPGERAVALDRADLQIKACGARIHKAWSDEPVHQALVELLSDARLALAAAAETGVEWLVRSPVLVAEHPGELVEILLESGFRGTLLVPAPGVPIQHGCPAAFLNMPSGDHAPKDITEEIEAFLGEGNVEQPKRIAGARQAYRQFDFGTGTITRDLVLPMRAGLPGGQPLLVVAIDRGTSVPVPLAPRGAVTTPSVPLVFKDHLEV